MQCAQAVETGIQFSDLQAHFQPIVNLHQSAIIGYESLIRGPSEHPLAMPRELFAYAERIGQSNELEIACRRAALQSYARFTHEGLLFINANPNTLYDPSFPRGMTIREAELAGFPPSQIVIELSEQFPLNNINKLKNVITQYRKQGFKIALDDLGSAYAGLTIWAELMPDFVKIDRYFIQEIHLSPIKREFVRSIITTARALGAEVIAEGIETEFELRELQRLGVTLAQGYFIGYPAPTLQLQVSQRVHQVIDSFRQARKDIIAALVEQVPTVSPDMPSLKVLDYFINNKEIMSLPVIEHGNVLGGVRREQLLETFSSSFGRSLYGNKPIGKLMETNPLVVDCHTPLELVSELVTEDSAVEVHRQILVTENGIYQGIVSVRSILKTITDLRLQSARHANPLTLLPGNVPIHQEIESYLQSYPSFYVAYFDLNNFKPYNDYYGYGNGDRVLQWLGQILSQLAQVDNIFVGHVGGDDFVALFTEKHPWREFCEQVIHLFDNGVADFYHDNDRLAGGIQAQDRNGDMQFFGLLGLAIGVVNIDSATCVSHQDVAALASAAKALAKTKSTSTVHLLS
ncbi:GGDEF domain-containing protein [Pseudidiomarina woesei]|uniref:Diguanylate cyclase/phosphodiesterase n=1 Tax=Pseudidiomarina woesei TaxID=1381080 RepID=A0A0K6H339_9GAMM|nr:GGDEF domain-containing protein [Pseudidiomarina woesei]CUA85398.1 diguanylate cyclase/phosphodiesterase [Pseudidiomarina woesei]